MKRATTRAGLLAAALFGLSASGLAGAASAADLDYSYKDKPEPYAPYYYHRDTPPPAPRGEYYEDRRYGEQRYSEPPPYADKYGADKYGYRDAPAPGRYSNYDERPVPGPRDGSRYDQSGCLTKGEIRYRLKEHGWQDFQEVEFRSETAVVSARRPDGMLYRLEVDRCSGVIVNARLIDEGRGWRQGSRGPYTY